MVTLFFITEDGGMFFSPSGAVNILPSIEADNLWFNDKFEHIGCRTFVVHF